MAHDMHDDGFHEIQLSGKQLVFLFMATTVVSIVIFLCGVLVGRGTPVSAIGDTDALEGASEAAAAEAGLDETPAAPQSNEPTSVRGLSYPERLQANTPAAEAVAPPPPAPASSPASTEEPSAVPARADAAAPEPARPVAREETTPAPTAAPAAAASGGFTVQVTALKSRADADAIARRLQSRGYPAYVVAPDAGGQVIYKVRVGMNMARPEAERVMGRLKTEEKFQPWITR